MIPIIHLRRIAIFGILFLSIMACSSDDDDEGGNMDIPSNSIANFVENNTEYSIFHTALELTGWKTTLSGRTMPFTVFAPNNEAFNGFLTAKGFENINSVPEEYLTQIVGNHILGGELLAENISSETNVGTMAGLSMFFKAGDHILINGNSRVTTPNIETNNGLIHGVDAVIVLPDIYTFLMVDPDFERLNEAFAREDDFDFLDFHQSQEEHEPFIIFAPTNEAFDALLEELEIESLDDISEDNLESILKYHVVPETAFTFYDSFFTTLETGQITAFYNWDWYFLMDENNREVYVIRIFQATNGNILKINQVLLPEL